MKNGDARERVLAQYRTMHESRKKFRGASIKWHIGAIRDLVEKHKPVSLLDYGSGKGEQYSQMEVHEQWGGLKPTCYDPGYAPLAKKPDGKFDGVICTDVAEHWVPEFVEQELATVIGYARKFVFFCIFTQPANKRLPDGRNAHLTCRPEKWWVGQIAAVAGIGLDGVSPIVGPTYERFPHTLIRSGNGVDIVAAFRGS